jgi:hypothetical protein
MQKKDKLQIIDLIIEAYRELDEDDLRFSKKGTIKGNCFRMVVSSEEDLRNYKWRATKSFKAKKVVRVEIADGHRIEYQPKDMIEKGDIISGVEYDELDAEDKSNFINCWGDYQPLYVVYPNGKKEEILTRTPKHVQYIVPSFGKDISHLVAVDRASRADLGYEKHGQEPARVTDEFITDPEGNLVKNPRYGEYIMKLRQNKATPISLKGSKDVALWWTGKELLVPCTCEEIDEFIDENNSWLRAYQRYFKTNPIFIRCHNTKVKKGEPAQRNIRPAYTNPPSAKELDVVVPSTSFDIERYSKDVDAVSIRSVTGKKASVSEQIKTKVNTVLRDKFRDDEKYYNEFTKRSIPPIMFTRKFLNNHITELTNDNILYQGLNFVSYDSDEDFLNKIFARAQNKKYDVQFINNEINLAEVKPGETLRFDVDVRYDGPRREQARISMQLSGEGVAQGIGKNNYIKGHIVAYDNKRNRLTIMVDEVVGDRKGDRWAVRYLGENMYYVSRQFNKKYANWALDKGAQFELNPDESADDKTLTRWEGTTQSLKLDRYGYQKPNPSTTLSQLWTLTGTREGNRFTWNLKMKLQYGTKDDSVFTGRVNFKDFNLSPDYVNDVYNGSVIESTVTVGIDDNIQVDGNFICTFQHRNSQGQKVPVNTIISADEFNNLPTKEKEFYTVFTVIDLLPVREGLEQVIFDFMNKVKAIDPQQALVAVDISQQRFGNLDEGKLLVDRILNEIKLRYS